MNYTKGEWKVTQWIEKHGFNVFSETGGFVASVPMNVGLEHTMIEAGANAHLIAAAPDMYEALKALVKYHEREGKAIPCLVDATEALAKAEVKDDNILR